jgi:hypothetical protein
LPRKTAAGGGCRACPAVLYLLFGLSKRRIHGTLYEIWAELVVKNKKCINIYTVKLEKYIDLSFFL